MKKLWLLLILSIPVIIFLNVWQVYNYDRVKEATVALEEQQREWLERNKRLIAGIAVLRSPERIDGLAREQLELKKLTNDKILHISIDRGKGDIDG